MTETEVKRILRQDGYGRLSTDADLRREHIELLEAALRAAPQKEGAAEPISDAVRAQLPRLERPPDRELDLPRRDKTEHRVVIHQDVWMQADAAPQPVRRKLALALRQLLIFGLTPRRKAVRGAARGWWRTPLGGNSGNQFYLWWAAAGGPILKNLGIGVDTLLVRSLRHHDETSTALDPGGPDDWMEVRAQDLVSGDLAAEILTDGQLQALARTDTVRVFRGQPGVGKTLLLTAAAERAGGSRAIAVTYNHTLAARIKRELDAFAPSGLECNVLTFDELVALCAPPNVTLPEILSPAVAAARMKEVLSARRIQLGPWKDAPEALYAVLHAEVAGAEMRRDSEPLSCQPLSRFGPTAAKCADDVINELVEKGHFDALFPAPIRAQDTLDFTSNGSPVPSILQDVDWFFVDEIQDLTQVECQLLVQIIRHCAAGGRRVGVVIVGDEGQTVRPTNFDWGWFNDLLSRNLARPAVAELVENKRSPSSIAHVVQQVSDLYRLIDKRERPRGSPDAVADDLVTGRVFATTVQSDDERARLRQAIAELPESAIVIPSTDVPPQWQGESGGAWTAAGAKGLDFRHVVVPLVGETKLEIERLAADGSGMGVLRARSLIDQLRVAVSRPTDTLVLVSEASVPKAQGVIEQLEQEIEGFAYLPVDEVISHLNEEFEDALERADAFRTDALKLLESDPREALRRAEKAVALVGAQRGAAAKDEALRRDAQRVRGMAALTAASRTAEPSARHALLRTANTALHAAKLAEAARGALAIRDIESADDEAVTRAGDLIKALRVIESQVPEVIHAYRNALINAVRALPQRLPSTPTGIQKALDTVVLVRDSLGDRSTGLDTVVNEVRRIGGLKLEELGHSRKALELLQGLEPREWFAEGRCHEKLEAFDHAADAYARAGRHDESVRMRRAEHRFIDAQTLIVQEGLPAQEAVAWAAQLQELLVTYPGSLSDEERSALLKQLRHTFEESTDTKRTKADSRRKTG